MVEQLKEILKSIADDKEVFELVATCFDKMVRALVNKGFTRDEAVGIVTHQGMGIKGN